MSIYSITFIILFVVYFCHVTSNTSIFFLSRFICLGTFFFSFSAFDYFIPACCVDMQKEKTLRDFFTSIFNKNFHSNHAWNRTCMQNILVSKKKRFFSWTKNTNKKSEIFCLEGQKFFLVLGLPFFLDPEVDFNKYTRVLWVMMWTFEPKMNDAMIFLFHNFDNFISGVFFSFYIQHQLHHYSITYMFEKKPGATK